MPGNVFFVQTCTSHHYVSTRENVRRLYISTLRLWKSQYYKGAVAKRL